MKGANGVRYRDLNCTQTRRVREGGRTLQMTLLSKKKSSWLRTNRIAART